MISDRTLVLAAELSRLASVEDIEEIPDWYLHRPIARRAVKLLLPTSVTPNEVTILSGVSAVLAAVALVFAIAHTALRLSSAALLSASLVLYCVYARRTCAR